MMKIDGFMIFMIVVLIVCAYLVYREIKKQWMGEHIHRELRFMDTGDYDWDDEQYDEHDPYYDYTGELDEEEDSDQEDKNN